MKKAKSILITPGEPGGIGPDIVLDIAQRNWDAALLVIADPELLRRRADILGISIDISEVQSPSEVRRHESGSLHVLPIRLKHEAHCGHLDPDNSQYVIDGLSLAEELCRTGRCDALVTGPVHKGIINDAGIAFTGHTEFLAAPSNSKPVMMLATESLRVALATTHLPLRQVSDAITEELLIEVIGTLNSFLIRNCKLVEPNIGICGLNPHAGEDGHLGTEEISTMIPALDRCAMKGIRVSKPLPADTIFTEDKLKNYDAILAMYHDQGLPVLKHHGFGKAVNITLGLPFVRTSVDHGTALELAGTGKASSDSLMSALDMAIEYSNSE